MGITKEYKKYASLQPNKIAIKENDRVLTYKDWFESVCKVANWLNEKESKNKTVAIVLENSTGVFTNICGFRNGWMGLCAARYKMETR